MTKILIIPDLHGRQFWKQAVASGEYDKVIFLGDYLDPYPDEQIDEQTAKDNFKEILSYYDQHPDKVVLLLGNHDLHYLSPYYHYICPSGRYNRKLSDQFGLLFNKQADRFKLAHEETLGSQHYLFTHAGVNMPWFKRNHNLIAKPDAHHLNQLLASDEGIETLAQVGAVRWGDYFTGSIIWSDCEEMVHTDPLPGVYQIIGHTRQLDGNPVITPTFACLDTSNAYILTPNSLDKL